MLLALFLLDNILFLDVITTRADIFTARFSLHVAECADQNVLTITMKRREVEKYFWKGLACQMIIKRSIKIKMFHCP